jgi:hypothetical protein
MLPIDGQHVLFVNSVSDHEIFDYVVGKVVGTLQSVICLSRSFNIVPAGRAGVSLSPCSVLSVPMMGPARPSAIVVTSQGRDVRVFSPFELPDFPNGLFQFGSHSRRYILFSFPGQSMLYEVNGQELVPDTSLGIDTKATTLDVSDVLKKGHSCPVQFTPREFVPLSPSIVRVEQKLPFDVIFVASNRCQLACYTGDRTIRLQDASVSEPGQSDVYTLEDDQTVTAIALSPPNAKGCSKYIVMGVRNQRGHFLVRFDRFSADPSFRNLHKRSIEDRVPCPVVSILFVGDTKPYRVLLGLDQGTIYFCLPDLRLRHLADVQSLRIGDGPVRFCRLGPTEVLALCSRPCLLSMGPRLRVDPLLCDSLSFAVPLGDPGLFLGVSSRLVSCYSMTDKSPVVIRPLVDPTLQAVSFCMIDGTRFVLIGHQFGLSLQDLASGRTYLAAKFVSRELVIQLSLPFPIQKPLGPPDAFLVAALGRAHGNSPSDYIYGIRLFRVDATESVPTVQQMGSLLIGSSRPMSLSAAASGPVAFIVAAFASRIGLYRLQGDTFVVVAESVIPGSALRHIGVPWTRHPQLVVWAADRSRSVSFLKYSEETRSFHVVAGEGFPRVISAFALDRRDIWVGDRQGNVVKFDAPPDIGQMPARRLRSGMHYYVGSAVTAVAVSEHRFRFVWYHTINGSLGGFMTLVVAAGENAFQRLIERSLRTLKDVEYEMAQYFFKRTACDHIAFRNKYGVALNVVDLDLLQYFGQINDDKKREIAEKVKSVVAEIEGMVEQMCTYFRLS